MTFLNWFVIYPSTLFVVTLLSFVFITVGVMPFKDSAARPFLIPFVILFAILDWIANWYCMTLVYLEFPAKLDNLVTDRLKRYQRDNPKGSYKYESSRLLCKLLNIFDKDHC